MRLAVIFLDGCRALFAKLFPCGQQPGVTEFLDIAAGLFVDLCRRLLVHILAKIGREFLRQWIPDSFVKPLNVAFGLRVTGGAAGGTGLHRI